MDSHVEKIKQIDLFVPPKSQYGVLHHFTEALAAGLTQHKIKCRLLEAKKDNPSEFVDTILKDHPQCTLSFNGLLPDKEGRFFCDLIEIPHLACIVDPPTTFLALMKSPYSIMAFADRYWVDFVKASGFKRVFFLPHGVDKSLITTAQQDKTFDVLMLSSFFDYKVIAQNWKKKFGAHFANIFEEAADKTLKDANLSFLTAVIAAIDEQSSHVSGHNPKDLDIITLLDDFETYIKAKDRIYLLQGITDARVDVFGSAKSTKDNWKSYFKSQANITAHDPIPFHEACDYMKKSKIVLNSCATIKNGAHERLLAGLACGATVFTSENLYITECFGELNGIVQYKYGKQKELNAQINDILADESVRQARVKKGQKLLLKAHTWDKRAAQLLKELPAMLHDIALAQA